VGREACHSILIGVDETPVAVGTSLAESIDAICVGSLETRAEVISGGIGTVFFDASGQCLYGWSAGGHDDVV